MCFRKRRPRNTVLERNICHRSLRSVTVLTRKGTGGPNRRSCQSLMQFDILEKESPGFFRCPSTRGVRSPVVFALLIKRTAKSWQPLSIEPVFASLVAFRTRMSSFPITLLHLSTTPPSADPPCPSQPIASTSCAHTVSVRAVPVLVPHIHNSKGFSNVLSAREPFSWLWLASPGFPLGAELPGDGQGSGHDDASDESIGPPICRLCVPAAGRRPHVLGVPCRRRNEDLIEEHVSSRVLTGFSLHRPGTPISERTIKQATASTYHLDRLAVG